MAAQGEVLAISGQIGWDVHEQIVSDDFAAQFDQALANVLAVVHAAGGVAQHLISLTVFVTDKRRYLAAAPAIGPLWRQRCGKHYPTMALVEVSALVEDRALVEIQGLAVLPSSSPPPESDHA
jgi:enamine deaminase RidA (YjgF/YER057c/UK114 family)